MKQLLLNHRGIDPFDTLGIKMQFKSRELLHYCKHRLPRILAPIWGELLKILE